MVCLNAIDRIIAAVSGILAFAVWFFPKLVLRTKIEIFISVLLLYSILFITSKWHRSTKELENAKMKLLDTKKEYEETLKKHATVATLYENTSSDLSKYKNALDQIEAMLWLTKYSKRQDRFDLMFNTFFALKEKILNKGEK